MLLKDVARAVALTAIGGNFYSDSHEWLPVAILAVSVKILNTPSEICF